MARKCSGIHAINEVCMAVLALADTDFEEMEAVIKDQQEYNHPLKMATTLRQGELAEHNRRVLDKVKELKAVLESGKELGRENHG